MHEDILDRVKMRLQLITLLNKWYAIKHFQK
jgi:hypothetical protein